MRDCVDHGQCGSRLNACLLRRFLPGFGQSSLSLTTTLEPASLSTAARPSPVPRRRQTSPGPVRLRGPLSLSRRCWSPCRRSPFCRFRVPDETRSKAEFDMKRLDQQAHPHLFKFQRASELEQVFWRPICNPRSQDLKIKWSIDDHHARETDSAV
jgi:hypothetical protein